MSTPEHGTGDDTPRESEVPVALTSVLNGDPQARDAFDRLSDAERRRHIQAIEGASSDEVREQRLVEILEELRGA